MSIPRKEFLVHKLVNHGKDIFAYSHVHTNQVIYSLERSLNASHRTTSEHYSSTHAYVYYVEPICHQSAGLCWQDHSPRTLTKGSMETSLGRRIPISTTRTRRFSHTA